MIDYAEKRYRRWWRIFLNDLLALRYLEPDMGIPDFDTDPMYRYKRMKAKEFLKGR